MQIIRFSIVSPPGKERTRSERKVVIFVAHCCHFRVLLNAEMIYCFQEEVRRYVTIKRNGYQTNSRNS